VVLHEREFLVAGQQPRLGTEDLQVGDAAAGRGDVALERVVDLGGVVEAEQAALVLVCPRGKLPGAARRNLERETPNPSNVFR